MLLSTTTTNLPPFPPGSSRPSKPQEYVRYSTARITPCRASRAPLTSRAVADVPTTSGGNRVKDDEGRPWRGRPACSGPTATAYADTNPTHATTPQYRLRFSSPRSTRGQQRSSSTTAAVSMTRMLWESAAAAAAAIATLLLLC
ncbi:hypothetical protein GALMADRAFT_148978 [Galerina marginata CBS 339.88]|uniref:Uncharacterized protein n=1 Tax=Galerina marginata (strain CBS 339.88) TaxID=685588 RepID=A0A067S2V5_GALM3|nr:hypothetical protein GALMADRAFT_148978 [Galerina marginata CBS 339.88]